ncbi:unnamed protein product [Schistosoma margrebowiei]|uniref:Uncharacterized protein n=1 Tax=Schistosoma margrebowiei TaxID=48269 RepID=A0AA85AJE1_9TREM|nr:unnamed protein product [Schistosoma margrebowiei]
MFNCTLRTLLCSLNFQNFELVLVDTCINFIHWPQTLLFYEFKTIRLPNIRIYIKPNDNGNFERGGYR